MRGKAMTNKAMTVTLSSRVYMYIGKNFVVFKKARTRHSADQWFLRYFKGWRPNPVRLTKIGKGILRDLMADENEIEKTSQQYRPTQDTARQDAGRC